MLLKIVVYGYMVGLNSSRKIEQACVERIDFRFLTGGLTPSFSTITKFRAARAEALAGLFRQSLFIAVTDDLVEMQEVAFDGTKILENASKHKAMSHERMCETVERLYGEIEALKASGGQPQFGGRRRSNVSLSSSASVLPTFKMRSLRLKMNGFSRPENNQSRRTSETLPIRNRGS